MPPVYNSAYKLDKVFDGFSKVDLTSYGINLIYIPNFLDDKVATSYYTQIIQDEHCLSQHSYIGNFNRTITPKRLTYAYIEGDSFKTYKFKGKPIYRRPNGRFTNIFRELNLQLPHSFNCKPDASIVNGYRYNGIDYISPHTDDEKFLMPNNTSYWSDSTVATITILRDNQMPMHYCVANQITGIGFSILARHGSIILQGSVLHEVKPVRHIGHENDIGRISITLRKFREICHHNSRSCVKPNCPQNLGPSNYLYYSNSDSMIPSSVKSTPKDFILNDEIILDTEDLILDDVILDETSVKIQEDFIIDDEIILDDIYLPSAKFATLTTLLNL